MVEYEMQLIEVQSSSMYIKNSLILKLTWKTLIKGD